MVFVLVSRSRRVVPDELVTLTSWDARDPVTEYPLLVAERRISLAILVSNVSRNFHFFVMFQQHFRSQQYGIGIVIYLARRRRKFRGLNESRSNLVMKFYVPYSKQCQYILHISSSPQAKI